MKPRKNRKRIDPRYFLNEAARPGQEAAAIAQDIAQKLGRGATGYDPKTFGWERLAKILTKIAKRASMWWGGSLGGYLDAVGADRECYGTKINELELMRNLTAVWDGLGDLQVDPNSDRGTPEYEEEFRVYIKSNLDNIKTVFVAAAHVNKRKLKLYPIAKKLADQCVPKDTTPL